MKKNTHYAPVGTRPLRSIVEVAMSAPAGRWSGERDICAGTFKQILAEKSLVCT